MGIKEKLLNLRKRITGKQSEIAIQEKETLSDNGRKFLRGAEVLHGTSIGVESTKDSESSLSTQIQSPIDLDDKVDAFINWYFENMAKDQFTHTGTQHKTRQMRDFIEKMAVWYELRYPDYEVNRMIPGSSQEYTKVDDVMFRNNSYVNDLLEEDADTKELEWSEFYNSGAFIKSLPWHEKMFFSSPKYQEVVYFDMPSSMAHLHLTKNGIVEMSEGVTTWSNFIISDDELTGLHVRRVVELFREKGIELPQKNELERTISDVDNWIYQKEEMLNCVMYRIIERGGRRIGPRRALLFAKEFKRNIDIPMMYGVDYSDPGLRIFINEYLKAGGTTSLECLVEYFERAFKNAPLKRTTIEKLLMYYREYTPEENELHQRLVNILGSQVNPDEVKKEEVKRLRLERKLEKSKMAKNNETHFY